MDKILHNLKAFEVGHESIFEYIKKLIKDNNETSKKCSDTFFNERTNILITYADKLRSDDKTPLQTLNYFANSELKESFSHIHLLPFYPWSSDDGFSPKNYHEVEKEYGSWNDIKSFDHKIMVDCVFNHISSQSTFFQKALSGDKEYLKWFHHVDKKTFLSDSFQEDIKNIVRPRTSPLFSPFMVGNEERFFWTTFGSDQIDLNISHTPVLKYLIDCLFLYIENGARVFRIDAIPFIWKELGTNCSHHPKTHLFVQLLRSICDELNQELIIITESNVPHNENISYWGNGDNEAHLIYNFSLPPLLIHGLTFKTNNYLHQWCTDVFKEQRENYGFFNFTASHDGIGLRGLEGIVPIENVHKICEFTRNQGGEIGLKQSRDGTVRPYELNITWASYLYDENLSEDIQLNKILNSHAIIMFLPGIPAHYIHNLFGTLNWSEGVRQSGIPRRINRKKLQYPLELNPIQQRQFKSFLELIEYKNAYSCFHPNAKMEILNIHSKVFSFKRSNSDQEKTILFNLTNEIIELEKMNLKLNAYELKII